MSSSTLSSTVDDPLSWLDEFDTGDPVISHASDGIRFINVFLLQLHEMRRLHEASVHERYLQVERAARTALEHLKQRRQTDKRAVSHKELAEAKRSLREIIHDGTVGRWRAYSLTDVSGIAALAIENTKDATALVDAMQLMLPRLREEAAQTPETFRRRLDEWIAGAYAQIRSFAYYTQQTNRNYLSSGKSAAWARTCNITALAMVLRALAITPHEFAADRRDAVSKIYLLLERRTADHANVWDEVSRLLLPDFLQLVAIEWFWEKVKTDVPSKNLSGDAQIELAKKRAANAVTSEATIFNTLTSRFGLRQYRVFPSSAIDVLPSIGRDLLQRLTQQERTLRRHLTTCLNEVWPNGDAPASVNELLWHIGFRAHRARTKIGTKMIAMRGPTSALHEKTLRATYSPRDEPSRRIDDIKQLCEASVRYIVAKEISPAKADLTGAEQQRVLHKSTREDVLVMAKKRKIFRNSRDVVQSVADAFHCHAADEEQRRLLMQEIQNVSVAPPLREAVKAILVEWEAMDGLLRRYRTTSGEQLRNGSLAVVRPLLDQGAAVVVLRAGHYVFLVDIDKTGITLNDPASLRSDGSTGKGTRYSWADANRLGFFRAFHVFFHPRNAKGAPSDIPE